MKQTNAFRSINRGYDAIFTPARLSLGLVVPVENHAHSDTPDMTHHVQRARLAEELGFAALWLRDVPFRVPSFGDAGQGFDPLVYLGALSACTSRIALGVASLILPLRHPAHVAKAAATADVLSHGRLILGVASGDRPEEYPALAVDYPSRGERFRDSYDYIRGLARAQPFINNHYGRVAGGMDMIPQPSAGRLPLLITGSSQQSMDWLAAHGDGWISYPRPMAQQRDYFEQLRARTRKKGMWAKPVIEPLYIDLLADAKAPATSIHLGLRSGINALKEYLQGREHIGVNHVALNLRFNSADTKETLRTLSAELLPLFNSEEPTC